MIQTRGIRKISENVLAPQRALIVTEKDKDKYKWEDIPLGSKFIDTATGVEMVKLEGQADWVPAGLKNDGTLNIAKDNVIKVESFTIKQETVSGRPNEFTYLNSEGQIRHGVKEWSIEIKDKNGVVIQRAGTLKGYIFQLEKGSYVMHRNHLNVTIDDILHRSTAKGGIEEVSETKFRMTEKLENEMEITVEYVSSFRMGAPYPRFFMSDKVPEQCEVGDFWLDTDACLDEDGPLDGIEDNKKIGWDRITNKPDSLSGYGIKDKLASAKHIHNAKDIVGLPKSLPANGGHADTADTAISASRTETATRATTANMAICDGSNRNIVATYMTKSGAGATGTWKIDITGKAGSAERATKDGLGRIIANTYLAPATGGTMSKALHLAKGWNKVGGTAGIGDIGRAGTLAVKGINGTPAVALVSKSDNKDYAVLGYDGKNITASKTIKGNITGNAGSASSVDWSNIQNKPTAFPAKGGTSAKSDVATSVANGSANMKFNWKAGKDEQPTWLWGGNDSGNMFVYKPGNFKVKHATSADNASTVAGHSVGTKENQVLLLPKGGKIAAGNIGTHSHTLSDITNITKVVPYATDTALSTNEGAIWVNKKTLYGYLRKSKAWHKIRAGYADSCASATSATKAANSDKLGGIDLSTLYRRLGGKTKPTVTPLIDWTAMQTAAGKSVKQRNTASGLSYFGGAGYKNKNTWPDHTIKLKESYKNFDKILVINANENGWWTDYHMWDVWELELAFSLGNRFNITKDRTCHWFITSKAQQGTQKLKPSTETMWYYVTNSTHIVEIYGIKY